MRTILSILFIGMIFNAAAQNTDKVTIGTIESIHSKILKEDRQIWVHVPNSDTNSLFTPERYPVLYLLDGDAHFYSVMGMIQQLSEVNGNAIVPNMIIVGITNTDRTRDLTPTHTDSAPFGGGDFTKTSGGGEIFTSFIEKELMPHIDSLYPTAPYRMLIGHSLGGLMVINTLVHHPSLFNSYIAIDPSMWWDDQKLLKEAASVLKKDKYNGKSLFLAVANTMNKGMDTAKVKMDTAGSSLHIRSILQLTNTLKSKPGNGLKWNYKYYNDDDHGSVPLIAEYDALRFIFASYKMPQFENELDRAANIDAVLSDHYAKLSKEMGYKISPSEQVINNQAYNFLQNKMYDKAFKFFQMNIDNYPTSFNVYDSMGDYYEARGDKQKAIEYLKKALSIREFPDTRQKLNRLQGK